MLKFSDWEHYGSAACNSYSTKLQNSKYYLEISINTYKNVKDDKCFVLMTSNETLFRNIFEKYYKIKHQDEFDNIATAMIFVNEFILFLNKHMKLVAFL